MPVITHKSDILTYARTANQTIGYQPRSIAEAEELAKQIRAASNSILGTFDAFKGAAQDAIRRGVHPNEDERTRELLPAALLDMSSRGERLHVNTDAMLVTAYREAFDDHVALWREPWQEAAERLSKAAQAGGTNLLDAPANAILNAGDEKIALHREMKAALHILDTIAAAWSALDADWPSRYLHAAFVEHDINHWLENTPSNDYDNPRANATILDLVKTGHRLELHTRDEARTFYALAEKERSALEARKKEKVA